MSKKESGFQGRKRKAKFAADTAKFLEKVPKLTNLFPVLPKKDETSNLSEVTSSAGDRQISEEIAKKEDTETIFLSPALNLETGKDFLDSKSSFKSDNFVFNNDPSTWESSDNELIEHLISLKFPDRNISERFSKSVREYPNQKIKKRKLTSELFVLKTKNGELVQREWLIYSTSTGNVYCYLCKLFSKIETSFSTGFSDWKHAERSVKQHENSIHHRMSAISWTQRCKGKETVDVAFTSQFQKQCEYWRNVMRRVLEVIRHLSQRGLAFRGNNEHLGSLQNGNFLGCLELLAKFDPFLHVHLETHGNKGRGHPSYVSSTICDEFIVIIAKLVKETIVKEVRESKYYSISVDSTPDLSHNDQLTFTLRYVNKFGEPVERFFDFIQITGHGSAYLEEVVLNTLEALGIDIQDCRGQTYDNASNMAGQYSGLQQRIKNTNPLADFEPCSAHSLNLVGVCAAESTLWAVSYFDFLQKLYNFFSASTHRWNVLLTALPLNAKVLKSLSVTRWSARADASEAVRKSFCEIRGALLSMSEDYTQKPVTRLEAKGLASKFDTLEIALMTIIWDTILERFNAANKALQGSDMDLGTVLKLYDSLSSYLKSIRSERAFQEFERSAMQMSDCHEYKAATGRKKKRVHHFDESNEPDIAIMLSANDCFRTNTYYVLIDTLVGELSKRRESYSAFELKFGFLSKLTTLTVDLIREHAANLLHYYSTDIQTSFVDELLHFAEFMKTYEDQTTINMLSVIRKENLQSTFPNVDIVLRICLCKFATNCKGERSFSRLKQIKNELRTTMKQERMSALSLLSIESDVVNNLCFDEVLNNFSKGKVRKMPIYVS